jgi:hypothetical protein
MTLAELISAFSQAHNPEGDAERPRLLSASCLPDAVFASPRGPTAGIATLSASIAEFGRAFPAAVVSFGRPDQHGGFARVAWTTRWNNGSRPWPVRTSPNPPRTGASSCSSSSDEASPAMSGIRRVPTTTMRWMPVAGAVWACASTLGACLRAICVVS